MYPLKKLSPEIASAHCRAKRSFDGSKLSSANVEYGSNIKSYRQVAI